MSKVLIMRTCSVDEDGKLVGYGGFPYPENGVLEAPDEWKAEWGGQPSEWKGGYDPAIDCGAGLHGISSIDHNWSLLSWDMEAKALLITADSENYVSLKSKCKFKTGIVTGVMCLAKAMCQVVCRKEVIEKQVEEIQKEVSKSSKKNTGDSAKLASSGYSAKLASSGDYAQLASSGYSAQLASSGNSAQLASSGENSTIAAPALGCRAKAGKGGAICLAYKCEKDDRVRFATGYVGEDLEADTWYQVVDGVLKAWKKGGSNE